MEYPINLPWKCPMKHAMWPIISCSVVWPWDNPSVAHGGYIMGLPWDMLWKRPCVTLSYTVEGSMTRLQHDILLLQHTRLGSLACSTTNHLEKRDLVASPLKGSL